MKPLLKDFDTEIIEIIHRHGGVVFYHNHGDPGPGVYLPREWKNNRAVFHDEGTTVTDPAYAQTPPAGYTYAERMMITPGSWKRAMP